MIALICTDGQMNINEIEKECVPQNWIPIVALKKLNDQTMHIPVFNLLSVANQFMQRNLPRQWKKGCVYLANDDIATIIKRGWKFMEMPFPRKFTDNKEFEITFEILDFKETPDFKVS